MTKTFFLLAAAFFVVVPALAQKEKRERIEGNGIITTREVPVASFDALKASGAYELVLAQGNQESLKIEADENLHQYFDVRNEGKKLIVEMTGLKNKSLSQKSKLKVYITFRELKEIELHTVGTVKSDEALSFRDLKLNNNSVGKVDLNISASSFNLLNKSVGNIILKGKAESAVVKNSGVGNLDAGNFVVQTMNIDNTGIGNAEVHAVKGLVVTDNMLGKVKNKGAAPVRKNNKVRI